MSLPRVFMVLPAYNEEKCLGSLLDTHEDVFRVLHNWGFEHRYIVVNDGSKDATAAILRERQRDLPLTVITHEVNKGLGVTIRDGLRRAAEMSGPDDIVFSMDADNTHPAGLMLQMTQLVLSGNDVVIASRYRAGACCVGLSRFRSLMSFGARILFQLVYPIPGVRDYTCGYRAYRATVLKQAFDFYGDSFIEFAGFQAMADILLKLRRFDLIIVEVPMILRYDWKRGSSKMNVRKTVFNTLKMLVKRRFVRPTPVRTG